MVNNNKRNSRDDKSKAGSRSAEGRRAEGKRTEGRAPSRKFEDKPGRKFEDKPARKFEDKPGRKFEDKPAGKFGDRKTEGPKFADSRPFRKRETASGNPRSFSRDQQERGPRENRPERSERRDFRKPYGGHDKGERIDNGPNLRGRKNVAAKDDGLIRLNRYIANSGICSRRKADELITAGVISVNGDVVSELGFKVDPRKDVVKYNGELLKREKKVYVLLNKPKDYITTTDDPQERRTVMHLVEKASRERIYPVGRLDRNTTGLLLMTNDGELADKLSHPKNGITKIYHVELNRNLSQGDMNKIQFGLELEDGFIKPDSVSYVTGASKKEIGIQIHSGKNRIVRRIFEHLGYDVVKLDRVVYGNLTKKDLPRGKWRFLEEHELIQIKHLIK
ncbi:pseudouridine synthase [Pedobacter faecalis]|uniref:pseudouridine synthase n=1 Tax=Pedobacter faecalis TaxID=3041495 RepID=UPI002550A278|nr:pseudouridine synthase [Pedobacter sp. ELA7]